MRGVQLGVRLAITAFIAILLSVVVMGWSWTTTHQPQPSRTASQIVLGISGLAGVFALTRIWRPDPPRTGAKHSKAAPGGSRHA